VCTADRPPELRDTGAGQTIDQTHLYGNAVRWYCDPGPPVDEPGAGVTWRSLAARAVGAATGPPAGPVHLNLPFREPLVPTGAPLVDAAGRADGAPWTIVMAEHRGPDDDTVAALAARVRAAPRGALVAGWGARVAPETAARFAAAAGWPVLADPLSGLRTGPHAVSSYDALLRDDRFADAHRPDLVVRVGAPPTGKPAVTWLGPDVAQVLVDPDRAWLDPRRAASQLLAVDDDALVGAVADALDEPPGGRSASASVPRTKPPGGQSRGGALARSGAPEPVRRRLPPQPRERSRRHAPASIRPFTTSTSAGIWKTTRSAARPTACIWRARTRSSN
jgi:2-succinyl-5-enolpyruvyl-6-hydroxy-3-cyclohexene-1-carboxylate synthase